VLVLVNRLCYKIAVLEIRKDKDIMHTQKLTFTNGVSTLTVEPREKEEIIKAENGTEHHVFYQWVDLVITEDGVSRHLSGPHDTPEINIGSPWLWNTINMIINSPNWKSEVVQHNGPPTGGSHYPEA
jgi:hypothetical protein|tara:strand:- start:125 stop:505 length:381 start_codon:yes stop_codon:yes gene_type:complete